MNKVEIIVLKNEEEYRAEYAKAYLNSGALKLLNDVPVIFSEKDFDHIFWEKDIGGENEKFSPRRAKRMYFMKALLSGEFNVELMYQPDRGTFALFCEDLECVMYLRARQGSGVLQVGTFFDFGENHAKMLNRQKKKCVPITLLDLKAKL